MSNKLTIIKTGGALLDDADMLNLLIAKTAALPGFKIIIHGGGKTATDMCARLGIEPKMINGRRITDAATLDVVTMVYAGLINKNLTARLQAADCNAIGLCGVDGNLLQTKKRSGTATDYGFAGDCFPGSVNESLLCQLLLNGFVPVIAPITHDGNGQLLNTNADTIAAETGIALSETFETTLIYCFEKNGVLENINDENTIISKIDAAGFALLKEKEIISKGMLPKLENALRARPYVKQVLIMHPRFIGGSETDPKTEIVL